jgi:tetratricopeptide (TPR) repeat protein
MVSEPGADAQVRKDIADCIGSSAGSPEKQIDSCTAAIESHAYAGKNLANAYHNRGVAHHARRELDQAIADYTAAIGIDGNISSAYSNRALAHAAQSAFDRAAADYDRALALDPGDVAALRGRGNLRLNKKNYDGGSHHRLRWRHQDRRHYRGGL